MGRRIGSVMAVMATLLLAACQSPDLVVSALPPNSADTIVRSSNTQTIEASVPMPSGVAADAPSGYVAFCARQPTECVDAPGKPDVVALNADTWHLLQQTNSAFNAAIKPEEDSVHYGRADYWTIPTDGYGDCEDYALAKRKALVEAGFSPRALRIAVARSKEGEAHAVLTVATDRGDYVLDNLTDAVLPWNQTNLGWIARQMPGGSQWASLSGDATRFRTASIAIPAPRP